MKINDNTSPVYCILDSVYAYAGRRLVVEQVVQKTLRLYTNTHTGELIFEMSAPS